MPNEFVVRRAKYQTFIWNFMQSEHKRTVKIYSGVINLLHIETGKYFTSGTQGHNIIQRKRTININLRKRKNDILITWKWAMITLCIKRLFYFKKPILKNKHPVLFWLFNTFIVPTFKDTSH